MGEFSIAHILVVGIAVLVLFGRGKVGSFMGEVGKGIAAFKHGLSEEKANGSLKETATSGDDLRPVSDAR